MLAALVNTRASAAFITQSRLIEVPEAMIKHLFYDTITLYPIRAVEHSAFN
jgi:hypothetical protein